MSNKKTEEGIVKQESKSERLDRMEEKMELIEKGLLAVINLVVWNNDSITPIGTHDITHKFGGFDTLEEAVDCDRLRNS